MDLDDDRAELVALHVIKTEINPRDTTGNNISLHNITFSNYFLNLSRVIVLLCEARLRRYVDHGIDPCERSSTTQQSNTAKPPQPRIHINIYY